MQIVRRGSGASSLVALLLLTSSCDSSTAPNNSSVSENLLLVAAIVESTVAVVDLDTRKVVRTWKMVHEPVDLAVSPDHHWAVAPFSAGNRILLIDLQRLSTRNIDLTGEADFLSAAFLDDSTFAVGTSKPAGVVGVSVNQPPTRGWVDAPYGYPWSIAAVGNGRVWTANRAILGVDEFGGTMITQIDLSASKVIGLVRVDSLPLMITATSDRSELWLTHELATRASVLDSQTGTALGFVDYSGPARGFAHFPNGSTVAAIYPHDGSIKLIHRRTRQIIATTILNGRPKSIAVSPDGDRVYVGIQYRGHYTSSGFVHEGTENGIAVLDATNLTELDRIQVGYDPYEIRAVRRPR